MLPIDLYDDFTSIRHVKSYASGCESSVNFLVFHHASLGACLKDVYQSFLIFLVPL